MVMSLVDHSSVVNGSSLEQAVMTGHQRRDPVAILVHRR